MDALPADRRKARPRRALRRAIPARRASARSRAGSAPRPSLSRTIAMRWSRADAEHRRRRVVAVARHARRHPLAHPLCGRERRTDIARERQLREQQRHDHQPGGQSASGQAAHLHESRSLPTLLPISTDPGSGPLMRIKDAVKKLPPVDQEQRGASLRLTVHRREDHCLAAAVGPTHL